MSEELIRHWIKKFKSNLECEKAERRQFEKHVRTVEKELKEKKKLSYPDD